MGKILWKKNKNIKSKKSCNKGSSMILVILAIAFIGALVSMVSYASYYNYLMKYSDRASKDNFYTAETALEEINAGLQREVAEAMSEAYILVMKENPTASSSLSEKSERFADLFKTRITERLAVATNVTTMKYKLERIKGYFDTTRPDANGVGATLITEKDDALIDFTTNSMILKDISIRYINSQGYVSMISTDIQIEFPRVSFLANSEVPKIEQYAIITRSGILADNLGTTTIKGNVYGGELGIVSADYRELIFEGDASNPSSKYDIIARSLVARNSDKSSITIGDNCDLWTEDIRVISAGFTSQGRAYVKDDLTIDGRSSRVKLAGEYFGYGDALSSAQDSAAILVNGVNTSIDFSELTRLSLYGHAYIGVRHYDIEDTIGDDYISDVDNEYGSSDSTGSGNNNEKKYPNEYDLMLGQSLAVKTDQLMYLAPTECMGYEIDENGAIVSQVLAKNPITIEEYERMTKTTIPGKVDVGGNPCKQYDVFRTDVVTNMLGKTLSAYSATCQPVFRRVNDTLLVYYYLSFNSESMANKFFVDYYNADKESFDAYIKQYIRSYSWNNTLNTSGLNLAGNMVYINSNGAVILKQDTIDANMEDNTVIMQEKDDMNDTYAALSAKLLQDINLIEIGELNSNVFDNLVDSSNFGGYVTSGRMDYSNDDGSTKAVIIDNKNGNPYNITNTEAQGLALVIASGDVTVSAHEFSGLILSGGRVTIESSCNRISYNPAEVKKALSLYQEISSSGGVVTRYAADVLINSDAYITYRSDGGVVDVDEAEAAARDAEKEDEVRPAKLIRYVNWSKE